MMASSQLQAPAPEQVARSMGFPLYHPDDTPPLYGLICDGKCMEPALMDGQVLLFSRTEPWRAGDFVAVYRRPEAVPQGENPVMVKRLISAPPASFFIQEYYREAGLHGRLKGTTRSKVIVRMLNPDRSLVLNAEDVLALHKCLGALPGC